MNADTQRVRGGAERTAVRGFNGVGKAAPRRAAPNSLGAFFSTSCSGHDEALLRYHSSSSGSPAPVCFTAHHSQSLGALPSMHRGRFILEAPLGFQASFDTNL